MSIRTRRLEPADRQGWERLFRAYIEFYRAEISDEIINLTWQRLVSPSPEILGLVAVAAEQPGAPLGIALAVLHRSTWSPTFYCYLEDLYVEPGSRGRGIGRELIEAVYREADGVGASRTYWVTEENNAAARSLYDKVATRAPFVQYRR